MLNPRFTGLMGLALTILFLTQPSWGQTVWTCSSCSDCSEYLQNGSLSSGDTLLLTENLSSQGDCIIFNDTHDVNLDCSGFSLQGDGSGHGIHLNESTGNNITGCVVKGFGYGIYINGSSGNLIYNNILNNTENAYPGQEVSNSWNTSLECSSGPNIMGMDCLGGNYWASPPGDGFSDTCVVSVQDWICDSEYEIDADDKDWLPLSMDLVPADTTPPLLAFVSPTPGNGEMLEVQDWAHINVSGDEALGSCLLDWNGTNESITASGQYCYVNKTGLQDGEIIYSVYGSDPSGNMGWSGERNLSVSLSPPDSSPVIEGHDIPVIIPLGGNVSIGVNVTDEDGIGSVWAVITDPGGDNHTIGLINNQAILWQSSLRYTHDITIFANDTLGNQANVSGSFYVDSPAVLNITVMDSSGDGIEADMEIYLSESGRRVYSENDGDGGFIADIVDGFFDLAFEAYNKKLGVRMFEVEVNGSVNGSIGLDYTDDEFFEHVLAVDSEFAMERALVTIDYGRMDFDDEENLMVFVCDDWDFMEKVCDSKWEELGNVSKDEVEEVFVFERANFSAFGVIEEPECGDGICGPGEEPENCSDDCACTPGETRPCSDEHKGACAVGTETCQAGIWVGCPSPIEETCNQRDDDCDGVIDDVNGGTSVGTSKCQCYADSSPLSESCNGIDDDCDGEIDEGSDCCIIGQTRSCGPATDTGECAFGTSSCPNGVWGTCVGAVYPVDEVCWDGKDNDCDGQVDEECTRPGCQEGEIGEPCICEGSVRDYGYCCSGEYSEDECIAPGMDMWSLILIVAGVVILVVLVIAVLVSRKHGKELTWEELRRKWSRPGQPPAYQ